MGVVVQLQYPQRFCGVALEGVPADDDDGDANDPFFFGAVLATTAFFLDDPVPLSSWSFGRFGFNAFWFSF